MLGKSCRASWRRVAGIAAALSLAVVAGSAAAPEEIAVGSFDAQTGSFRVRESVLKKTFADGTPVGRFQIRYFSRLPLEIEAGFFLVRSTIAASVCQTEATRVVVHDNKAWIERFELPRLVIDCGGPAPDCPSCDVRTESNWSCGCFAGGEDTGLSCPTTVNTLPTAAWVEGTSGS
jgi:hypothetical protein